MVHLSLKNNTRLGKWQTMQMIKKELQRESLNGMMLYVSKRDKEKIDESDEDDYIDECALLNYINGIAESGSFKTFEVFVEIPLKGRNETVSLNIFN